MNCQSIRSLRIALLSATLVLSGAVFSLHARNGVAANGVAENNDAVVARVGEDIRFLASDELQGRGPGTEGLERASQYIRDRFDSLGLHAAGVDGTYVRPFEISVENRPVPGKTHLTLRGPEGQEIHLRMGEDFQPMVVGGGGNITAGVVFAGYGITARKLDYDDYLDADVEGKVVLILRHEPQQDDENSVFNGRDTTTHSAIRTKLQVAKKCKAAAILLVNDPFSHSQAGGKDVLSPAGAFGSSGNGILFAHMKQRIADQILARSPIEAGDEKLTSIAQVENLIDTNLHPLTQPMTGWTADMEFCFEEVRDDVSNVIAVMEGEGPLANETIVIGAHYDHLGYGPRGSRRPDVRAIHNGADDNATGTAALMELARRFQQRAQKPARRLVFIAFTAEERGLVGAKKYLESPIFPIENTVAMINFDMIGNLRDGGVILGGVPSAKEFPDLVERVAAEGNFQFKPSNLVGGSDHAAFYRANVPVLFFFTGVTEFYHTPEDDFERINVEGVATTIDFAERVLDELLRLPKRPEFSKVSGGGRPGRGATAYLGIVPNYNGQTTGAEVVDVVEDSPASRAGLKKGDLIVKLGDVQITSNQELLTALRKYKADDTVGVEIVRETKPLKLDVQLGRP